MNASASRIEYRNSEVIKKSTKTSTTKATTANNIPPPPSTTVKSLKSDTPRPESSATKLRKDEQNGYKPASKSASEKRKSNGHPPSKPGTSTAAAAADMSAKIPTKKRKIETPQKPACPIDLIMDEMNNLESQKRKSKKKEDSDSESTKGIPKGSTPLPGTFKAPTYLDLLRIESDNSMVFEFLNKRVPSVCEMVLAYKMLRGRVDNFNLTYYDRTKIKNLQSHIPPDAEILQELRGPDVFFEAEEQQQTLERKKELRGPDVFFEAEEQQQPLERKKGPRTPSGSPPSPTPPPEEKSEPSMPAGFIPDMDQSSEAQEQRRYEVKKYLAKRVNKDIKDVEGMLTESHWKLMGSLKKELMFTMIDQMVEAATNTSSNAPDGNSVAMDISSNSSSINEKLNQSKSTKAGENKIQASTSSQSPYISQQQQQQPSVTNLVTGGFQIYGSQQPMYQHSYPPSHQQNPQVTIPSINQQQQIIQTPPKVQQQQQQTFQTPIQATPPSTVYPIMQNVQHQPPASMPLPPPQQQHIRHPSPIKPIQESLVPFSSQPRFTPLPNSMPSASIYFPSTSAVVPPPSLPPPKVPTPSPAKIPPPSQPPTVCFRPPFSSANNPPVQHISQPTNIASLNNVENFPARLPPPTIVQQQQRSEIRPNLQRPGTFPPPQRLPPQTSMRPPRMNTNGPYPQPPRQQQPPPPQNMQRPQQPLMRPSVPTPDSSSVMRTLFSALHTTTPQQQ
uniref:Uncharacterized protein n=1 Tax=Panagrolaimus sp. PS1159 TaxID=55785 RepID=A0AC35FQK7_9BILA